MDKISMLDSLDPPAKRRLKLDAGDPNVTWWQIFKELHDRRTNNDNKFFCNKGAQ